MGYLKQIEDLLHGTVLLVQPPTVPAGEFGWSHRNATFTLASRDYGASPFSGFPAPMAPRKWPWTVRVYGFMSGDSARDSLASAIGMGKRQRLVYHHDKGYERICNDAVAYDVSIPHKVENDYFHDFTVTWELNEHWTERIPVNSLIYCGALPFVYCGQTTPNIYCGSSSVLPITSATYTISSPSSSMVDSSSIGPGGIATMDDTQPIISIHGPFGGSLGFAVANPTDPYGCAFLYTKQLTVTQLLTIDCGAWSASVYDSATNLITNVIGNVMPVVNPPSPYLFAIGHGIPNTVVLTSLGSGIVINSAFSSVTIQWYRKFV